MSTLGKIRCDICLHIADLEIFNGAANLRTPKGWGSVNTSVRVYGLTAATREARANDTSLKLKIKERVAKKFPQIHMCPGCLSNHIINDNNKPLTLASGKANIHTDSPPQYERSL